MKTLISICLLFILSQPAISQHIIPTPANIYFTSKGTYTFQSAEQIYITDSILLNEAKELQSILKKRVNCNSEIIFTNQSKTQNIALSIQPDFPEPEGYLLTVTPKRINISGRTASGIFYGIQTFNQLLIEDGSQLHHSTLPCLKIEDAPRYGYRALMLDPARHFIPMQDVKRFIDIMSLYKFNVLQIHLTDDQGWRIEINAYPELTRKGAFRNNKTGNQGPHNGFYTQEELRQLVAYAASKHIEIIPELDIPGHTVAAIKAYPQLGCRHLDSIPISLGKTADRTLCAAKEEVYSFYSHILKEVNEIFPSKRIHLGGDEAVIEKNWGHCPDCQKLMQTQGYTKTSEIMGYFFGRIHEIVRQNGKELMLWCELDNIRMPAHSFLFSYPKDCTLFTWRMGLTPKAIELTEQAGIQLIASPGEHCYFDYPQYKGDLPEFNNWGMPLPTLKQAYDWDPGYGLPADKQKHIIGVAGLLWGEAMQDINRITYMAYPRALALAETGWSTMKNRNWETFKTHLPPHLLNLMREGINFRVPFEIYQKN